MSTEPSSKVVVSRAFKPPEHGTVARVPRVALSAGEAAESLGVSRGHFDEHIAHELRWVYRGRRKFVAVAELERWLEREAVRPSVSRR